MRIPVQTHLPAPGMFPVPGTLQGPLLRRESLLGRGIVRKWLFFILRRGASGSHKPLPLTMMLMDRAESPHGTPVSTKISCRGIGHLSPAQGRPVMYQAWKTGICPAAHFFHLYGWIAFSDPTPPPYSQNPRFALLRLLTHPRFAHQGVGCSCHDVILLR